MKAFVFVLLVAAAVGVPIHSTDSVPAAIILPAETNPEPVILPEAAVPEVKPEIIPEPVIVAPEIEKPEIVPEPVIVAPEIEKPEIVPEHVIVVPEIEKPEIVLEPVIVAPEIEKPEIVPEPVIVAPEIEKPEIVPEPVIIVDEAVIVPEPVQVVDVPQVGGEIFNDGVVQVTVNTPQETGVLATLQSWFSLAFNYISGGVQTTQQII